MSTCILCNGKATTNAQDNASRTIYNCHSCGVFVVSDLAAAQVKKHCNELAAYFTSRKLAGYNEVVLITYDLALKDKDYLQLTVDQILEQLPRTFSQTTDMILVNLARMSSYAGEEIKVEGLDMCPVFYVKKQNYDALSFIIKSMQNSNLIEVNYYSSSFFPCGVIIGPKGWDRLSEMEEGMSGQNLALIFLPSGKSDYAEPFRKSVTKAVRECGYKVVEANSAGIGEKAGYELIAQIKNANFVICGMTHATGVIYYSAGLARAFGKTTILTCHEDLVNQLEVNTQQISVLTWGNEKQLYLQVLSAIRALVL